VVIIILTSQTHHVLFNTPNSPLTIHHSLFTIRLFACSPVRLFACSPVRLFACSPVRLFACSPVRRGLTFGADRWAKTPA
jgi:hypothetical protein